MLKMYIIISVVITILDISKRINGKNDTLNKINFIFFPSLVFEVAFIKLVKWYKNNINK